MRVPDNHSAIILYHEVGRVPGPIRQQQNISTGGTNASLVSSDESIDWQRRKTIFCWRHLRTVWATIRLTCIAVAAIDKCRHGRKQDERPLLMMELWKIAPYLLSTNFSDLGSVQQTPSTRVSPANSITVQRTTEPEHYGSERRWKPFT